MIVGVASTVGEVERTNADVVEIGADPNGHIALADLTAQLEPYADWPQRIGSFSAASNVTGILTAAWRRRRRRRRGTRR
jgi:selenocysteine lyase/cysteine desulfurase